MLWTRLLAQAPGGGTMSDTLLTYTYTMYETVYYDDWACDWTSPQDVPSQLRRRRAAALRSPRLACDRRDPNSAVMW